MSGNVINGGAPTLSLLPAWLGGHGFAIGRAPLRPGQHRQGLLRPGDARNPEVHHHRRRRRRRCPPFIGAIVGALAGYFRGWVDEVLMRMTDLFIVIPLLVLAAVLGQMAGSTLGTPSSPWPSCWAW